MGGNELLANNVEYVHGNIISYRILLHKKKHYIHKSSGKSLV